VDLELRSVHFIGIGGISMSGIARLLLREGVRVSGSDAADGAIVRELRREGAEVYLGHDARNVLDVDAVAYSTAIKPDNPELAIARERGVRILHRSELLSHAVHHSQLIAVTGTHGKTSTTALMGSVLLGSGMDPTILVGGVSQELGSNVRAGDGLYAVVEACESDRSFLNYHPAHVIVTNIEAEHLDNYSGLDDIAAAFREFVDLVPDEGHVVMCADCARCRTLAGELGRPVVTYGFSPEADIRIADCSVGAEGTQFTLEYGSRGPLGEWSTPMLGNHYAANAAGVVALSSALGLDLSAVRTTVAQFRGTHRRFEVIGEVDGALVVDDYAHHPTEIRATLTAARDGLGRRIIAVFQPHLYSRTVFLLDDFARSLALADRLFITDIYGSREGPTGPITGEAVVERVRELVEHPHVEFVGSNENAARRVAEECEAGDLILTMGAGDVRGVAEALVTQGQRGTE